MEALRTSLRALVDSNRLEIVSLLMQKDCCVGALANHLGISNGAVSQHLQVLRKAGLVSGEKRGYFTHYRVHRDKLRQTAEGLLKLSEMMPTEPCGCEKTHEGEQHCCGGEA